MPRPSKPATEIQADYVVLLRVFIDLYMNKLRLQSTSLEMANFVAKLPVVDENESFRPSASNLIEIFITMLQGNEPITNATLSLFNSTKVVLNVFGSMLRTALYSDEDLQMWRAASFVERYVKVMANSGFSHQIALAILARDLVLANENVPTEAQVLEAAATLQCFIVVIDHKPGLPEAAELLSRPVLMKIETEQVKEMEPHLYLELLVTGLDRGHSSFRVFCFNLALRFRKDVGSRMAIILEDITLLLVASDRIDIISHVIPWVNKQTIHNSGFLPYLAFFWESRGFLLNELGSLKLVPFNSWGVLPILHETIYKLKITPFSSLTRDKLPALMMVDEVRRLIFDRLHNRVEWPSDWPLPAPID